MSKREGGGEREREGETYIEREREIKPSRNSREMREVARRISVQLFDLDANHRLDQSLDGGSCSAIALIISDLIVRILARLPKGALTGTEVGVLVVVAVSALSGSTGTEGVEAANIASSLAHLLLEGARGARGLVLSCPGEANGLDPLNASATLALFVGGLSASHEHKLNAVVACRHIELLSHILGSGVGAPFAELRRVVVKVESSSAVTEGVDLVRELEVSVSNPLVDVEKRGGALSRGDVSLSRAVPSDSGEAIRQLLPVVVHPSSTNGVESRLWLLSAAAGVEERKKDLAVEQKEGGSG